LNDIQILFTFIFVRYSDEWPDYCVERVSEMQDEEMQVVTLLDNFYRDRFKTVLFIVCTAAILVFCLAGIVTYYYTSKPWPVVFAVEPKWQVQPPVTITKPFVSKADLLQWVSEVVPALFTIDFLNYDQQVANLARNFTANGWHVYQNQLKNFAAKDTVVADHTFISSHLIDAPAIINKGMLSGRYAWVITIPIVIEYYNLKTKQTKNVTFQIIVVRVPTETNLAGIAINDIIVAKNA